jgi:hypothetical protein
MKKKLIISVLFLYLENCKTNRESILDLKCLTRPTAGPGTKNDCAADSQQQFIRTKTSRDALEHKVVYARPFLYVRVILHTLLCFLFIKPLLKISL